MSETTLTRAHILDAAEDVLRRFGPSKATVVDVARALHVSHGSVYRHFASKAALRDAVTQVWLSRIHDPLETMLAEDGPADGTLYRWLRALSRVKRGLLASDPELFATYCALGTDAREVVREHVEQLTAQVARIVERGVAQGAWISADPAATARAVLTATARFHHPAHASEWSHPDIDTAFEEVWALLLRGLQARP